MDEGCQAAKASILVTQKGGTSTCQNWDSPCTPRLLLWRMLYECCARFSGVLQDVCYVPLSSDFGGEVSWQRWNSLTTSKPSDEVLKVTVILSYWSDRWRLFLNNCPLAWDALITNLAANQTAQIWKETHVLYMIHCFWEISTLFSVCKACTDLLSCRTRNKRAS
jgi:hypothetical protein